MGFFGTLFGSNKAPASEGAATPVTNEEVKALSELLGEKKDEAALAEGKALLARPMTAEQKETVCRSVGLALFQTKKFAEALEYFKPLCERSTDPGAWFNLASCSVMAGEVEEGFAALDQAVFFFPQHGNESVPPPPFMFFFFMQALLSQKAFPQAFDILGRLFSIFASVKNTDATFLALRGVPPFHDVLNRALSLFTNTTAATALMELREAVDEEGQATVDSLIEHLKGLERWPLKD